MIHLLIGTLALVGFVTLGGKAIDRFDELQKQQKLAEEIRRYNASNQTNWYEMEVK